MNLLGRTLSLIVVLVIASFAAFALIRAAPGGPFDRERKPASPQIEKKIQAHYHLDEPIWRQYLRFLSGLLRGDLGPSLRFRNHSVNDILRQGLPVTLTIGGMAFALALGMGISAGFLTAVARNQTAEAIGTFLTLLAICVPAFVLGPILVTVFAIKLEWFPVALLRSPAHFVLPTLTLAVYYSGRIARLMREGMLGVLQAEFIVAARAKGLSETAIYLRHALPLAILPVVSYSGPLLADLLTGSFVVENLFQIPGIGIFLVNSALNRDYPMVVGLVVVYAALLLAINFLVDVLYTRLDPRIDFEPAR